MLGNITAGVQIKAAVAVNQELSHHCVTQKTKNGGLCTVHLNKPTCSSRMKVRITKTGAPYFNGKGTIRAIKLWHWICVHFGSDPTLHVRAVQVCMLAKKITNFGRLPRTHPLSFENLFITFHHQCVQYTHTKNRRRSDKNCWRLFGQARLPQF